MKITTERVAGRIRLKKLVIPLLSLVTLTAFAAVEEVLPRVRLVVKAGNMFRAEMLDRFQGTGSERERIAESTVLLSHLAEDREDPVAG